jgi:chromosomal replication initiator protein
MDGAAVEHDVFAISVTAGTVRSASPNAAAQTSPASAQFRDNSEFIVGPENRLAGSTVLWLLNRAGHSYSPLVLYGASGTGKSHLAQSIAASRDDAVYIRGSDFARELVTAVEKNAMADFRHRFRTGALLVFDDLSQLIGRRAALEELQHTLDALEARDATAVIISRRPPQEMAKLPPALRSRLSGGLVVKVSPPGVAARRHLLERLALVRGSDLPPEAAGLLAEQLHVTAPELCGHFAQLEMEVRTGGGRAKQTQKIRDDQPIRSDGFNEPLKIEFQHAQRYLLHRRAQHRPSLAQVSTEVAKYYGLKPAAMSSQSRTRQMVLARAVAMYLGRTLCGASLKALGKHFGGRDHTTALHSFRQLQGRLAHDSELNGTVDRLRRVLTKRAS